MWRALYYALPKVYDLGRMTLEMIRNGQYDWWMPVWTSTLFGIAVLGAALALFQRKDF